jgi:uncharacterized protein YjbI with pentapeptide repeats
MNDQHDPSEQKAPEQPQQTEAPVPEPEPVAEATPEAAEPGPQPETIEAEVEAPPQEETEEPEAPPQVSAEQAPAEDGCPVKMSGLRQCGRPVYAAPAGVDRLPVCLMHLEDPAKSDEEFQKEFERILGAAGDGVADFTRFVFPSAVYEKREFAAHCIFSRATFTEAAIFYEATFTEVADFVGATFTQNAVFVEAKFTKGANFGEATFKRDAVFFGARFTRVAYFLGATFSKAVRFSQATFTQDIYFNRATFTQEADFIGARFTRCAYFIEATFSHAGYFSRARFVQAADFSRATFTQVAGFIEARFARDAHFREARFTHAEFFLVTFTQEADFTGATFAGVADFRRAVFTGAARFAPSAGGGGEEAKPCEFKDRALFQDARFQDYADFRGPVFGESGNSTARPVFSLARFERPERVTFYKTWLGQTLFVNCDVSKLSFSDVVWGRDGERVKLYEETVALGDGAETYHQLKNNYDSRGDPWTANDFHYGEMEMRRRSSRWPRIGLTALYKYASQYGLSMARPLAWLAGVLLLFTLLYPLAGLRPRTQPVPPAPQVKPITYRNLPEATRWLPRPVCLLRHSAMTTLAVASLQREAAYYEPAYGLGRLLGILELAATSTLAALFILAVRRQFKRGGD